MAFFCFWLNVGGLLCWVYLTWLMIIMRLMLFLMSEIRAYSYGLMLFILMY
ncbi:hypothetical protein HanPI659440_Chr14g0542971 [Helianthus annuus]|nr:hypothetical protein HanPI659440_Chr14g0542971 [Helianthus annuus]